MLDVDERNLTKDRYLAMCRMKSGPVIINEIKVGLVSFHSIFHFFFQLTRTALQQDF